MYIVDMNFVQCIGRLNIEKVLVHLKKLL
jgi:hypothetical protein